MRKKERLGGEGGGGGTKERQLTPQCVIGFADTTADSYHPHSSGLEQNIQRCMCTLKKNVESISETFVQFHQHHRKKAICIKRLKPIKLKDACYALPEVEKKV